MVSNTVKDRVLSSQSSSDSIERKSKIRFSTIEIREFNRTLGDNPACRDGPPISLDWDYIVKDSVSIDEYESKRLPRRSHHNLFLSMYTRRNIMLKHFGYTIKEIEKVEHSIRLIQEKRCKTRAETPRIEQTKLFAEKAKRFISYPFRPNLRWKSARGTVHVNS